MGTSMRGATILAKQSCEGLQATGRFSGSATDAGTSHPPSTDS
jgi:hypothetical protein